MSGAVKSVKYLFIRLRTDSRRVMALVAASALLIISLLSPNASAAERPVIIELTQTPCVIVEAEENPAEYLSNSKADCERINRATKGERSFKELRLKPGKTIFRVTNLTVPYDLGFWVRGKGVGRLTLPSASGGGLKTGATIDYEIDLKEGEYLYSCPLNPTPDYPLVVAE